MRVLAKVLMIIAILLGALVSLKLTLEILDLTKKRYVTSGND